MPLGVGTALIGAAGGLGSSLVGGISGQRAAEITSEASKYNTSLAGQNMLASDLANMFGNFVNNSAASAIQGVMGNNANAVSAQAQQAAGAFNQGSADLANAIDSGRLTQQYGFNSSQAAMANEFNTASWDKAAAWNETMWEKQAAFNAEQAEIQRKWSEKMENTKYQRAITDMEAAGLNPILAVTGGGSGISTGGGSASAASVGGAQMSSAQANMASGGLLGADQASINGYQGQLAFTGGVMNLLSTALSGIGSAQQAMSYLGDLGAEFIGKMFDVFGLKSNTENNSETKKPSLDWQYDSNYTQKNDLKQKIRNKQPEGGGYY